MLPTFNHDLILKQIGDFDLFIKAQIFSYDVDCEYNLLLWQIILDLTSPMFISFTLLPLNYI